MGQRGARAMLLKTSKRCTCCGEVKPLEDGFHHKDNTNDHRTSECRQCRNIKAKAWREKNPGYMKQWQEENREYLTTAQQARRAD